MWRFSDSSFIQNIEQLLLQELDGQPINGADSDDYEYTDLVSLWNRELQPLKTSKSTSDNNNKWYKTAYDFWEDPEKCPVNDDGVLQGYGKITPMDVRDSNMFLDDLANKFPSMRFERVADCGAGIGRVTKHLLLPRFASVDLVEQSPRLTSAAPNYIGPDCSRVNVLVQGLQDFRPSPNSYDVVWIQWVIGHLTDFDVVTFLSRCSDGLREDGVVVLKDNTSGDHYTFVVDKNDSSVSRCDAYLKVLIRQAGLEVVYEKTQTDFPEELFPVKMFAMKKLLS